MSTLLKFAKVEATGNDFIILHHTKELDAIFSSGLVREACDRHFGIGADGVITVKAEHAQSPQMRYFNADGSEGEMCGNGLRAAVLFAQVKGLMKVGSGLLFQASDGMHQIDAEESSKIKVEILTQNKFRDIDADALDLPEGLSVVGFTNTGVPHLVLKVEENLNKVNVISIGYRIRNHLMFQPEGTNINFLEIINKHHLNVRTYERGVEDETLSCGTGVTASALLMRKQLPKDQKQIKLNTRGGELSVHFDKERIFLEGPARIVFVGHYLFDDHRAIQKSAI